MTSCSSSTTILNLSGIGTFTRTRICNPKFYARTRIGNPFTHSFQYQVNVVGRNGEFSSRMKWCRLSSNATSLGLPFLPFNMNEVLVPSESKTLHLYEARYLALLEESLLRKKLFFHFVLDPILLRNSGTEASYAARHGCLVNIENIERLDVGALVSIRGIGRVKIVNFVQSYPYLRGEVVPLHDRVLDSERKVSSKILAVKAALYDLNGLEIKLKAPKDAPLQTHIANSLTWAEKEPSLDCDEAFIPSPAERISFAAFQPLSGSSQSEMLKLQQQKLSAMDVKDTLKRLDDSLELINENISMVASKLAIQSLGMQ